MVTDEAAVATTTLKRSHAWTTTPVTDEQEDEDGAKKKRARLVDAAFNAAEAWSPTFFRGALARAAALF